MKKTGECGDGSTKKQSEKLQSIFRIRWHSLDTSEVNGLLSLSHTHKMQLITKKKYYSRRLNTSVRMTLELSAVLNQS